MKTLKVYLQYPWGISDSQYYKSMINFPPAGVEYFPKEQRVGMLVNKRKIALNNFFKTEIRRLIEKFNIPILNTKRVNLQEDYDIIHFAHCLPKSNLNKPWVVDFEDIWQLFISGRDTKTGIEKLGKILSDKNCKKILAWTDSGKIKILKKYPELKEKVEVVGYGQKEQRVRKIKHKGIQLLFVARFFYEKGGLDALAAMDRITKRYDNVNAVIVSQTPKKVLDKYSNNNKMKFFDLMPHDKLIKEIFPACDILIHPGYSDTFGFIFSEAASFGIPVVSVDTKFPEKLDLVRTRKEIIEDGKTGFVISMKDGLSAEEIEFSEKEEIINEIVEKTEYLIKNPRLREGMSKNCIREIKSGKFSIKKRNEKLRRIYESSLN